MAITRTEGLRADWLNAWLAAIGICHLCPEVKLRWTDEPEPKAEFRHADGSELAEIVRKRLPERDWFDSLAIARPDQIDGVLFKHNPSLTDYRKRAIHARTRGDFSLTSALTDLGELKAVTGDKLPHSPFNPPAPRGITLWDRVTSCVEELDQNPEATLEATFQGTATRIQGNGLGFDYLRLFSPTIPDGQVFVDPTIEVLAFFGLSLFPVRGDGVRHRARGWTGGVLSQGAFTWPAWSEWLGCTAIDALLDHFYSQDDADWVSGTIVARYQSVPYRPKGSSDVTRGIGSERIG